MALAMRNLLLSTTDSSPLKRVRNDKPFKYLQFSLHINKKPADLSWSAGLKLVLLDTQLHRRQRVVRVMMAMMVLG
jgi:hypothetical protein